MHQTFLALFVPFGSAWKPQDPDISSQWHHKQINSTPAWDLGYTGSGVIIQFNTHGFRYDPEVNELAVSAERSWYAPLTTRDGNDIMDIECGSTCGSGTAMASLAAGKTNDYCGVGVAPGATVASWEIFHYAAQFADDSIPNAFQQQVDIMVTDKSLLTLGAVVEKEIESASVPGRQSREPFFIFGSADPSMRDSNHVQVQTVMNTITVSPLTRSGVASFSACPGSNTLISAPAGGAAQQRDSGLSAYADASYLFTASDLFGNSRCKYLRHVTPGFSASIVAGGVALMLEARPELSVRDVQHILVDTATRVDAGHPSWQLNGAGKWFSNVYGFGALNVGAAVSAARGAPLLPSRNHIARYQSRLANQLPITRWEVTRSSIVVGDDASVDAVQVVLDFEVNARGSLNVTLTSPSGTTCQFVTPFSDDRPNYIGWKSLCWSFWGEKPLGTWHLDIRADESITKFSSGVLRAWGLALRDSSR